MDEHVIEAMGKARVVIRNGRVVEVGEPMLSYCPIFEKFRGMKRIDKSVIAKNMQFRIDDFGMCRPDRKLRMRDYLSFGISEIISTAMDRGIVDAAVIVCEGCGTVVVDDPELVQGIAGRMSGLVSTTPIPEIIGRVGKERVLDPDTAKIDPIAGARKAIAMGYRNIAVSTMSGYVPKKLKAMEIEHGVNLYALVMHTTAMPPEEADTVFQYADIATGCASKHIRALGQKNNTYRVGSSVPIFGITARGRRLIEERVELTGKDVTIKPGAPQPDTLA